MSLINHKTTLYIHIQLKISNNKDFINNKELTDWIYKSISNYNNCICNIYVYIPKNDTDIINILIRSQHFLLSPYRLSIFFEQFNTNPLNLIKIFGIDQTKYNNICINLSEQDKFYFMIENKLIYQIANSYKYESIKKYTDYTILTYNTYIITFNY